MARHFLKDARLLFVFFLVVLFFVFAGKIFVVAQIAFRFVLVFLFVQIVRNQVQVDGMRLRYFQLRFAFGAAQNLAFFHFVFIDVNLGGTFGTANHGDDLRYLCENGGSTALATLHRIIYRASGIQLLRIVPVPPVRRDTASGMASSREYPERPLVGVGGVVILNERALLIRRGSEPLRGEWSIPGGMLELGESLQQGVARELLEETGLHVRVLDVIEVFDRIYGSSDQNKHILPADAPANQRPRFHYVIIDYLCEVVEGRLRAGSDVTDARFASEQELSQFGLTETASRVLQKAFAMYRARRAAG